MKRAGQTRPEPRAKAAVFWKKALLYRQAARLTAEAEAWDPAVSAAVHATISVCDAVCVRLAGHRSASESHDDAARIVMSIDAIPPKSREALADHLRALLAVKTFAEYGGELLATSDAASALRHMDRAFEAAKPIAAAAGWKT